jgi:hypothetical protein
VGNWIDGGIGCTAPGKIGTTMSMRKSSRSELRMLRVMMWHFGIETKCHFCHKPLLDEADLKAAGKKLFAGKESPLPIKTRLTLHHADGNHYNQSPENRKPCHQKCHKSFHMKEQRKSTNK